MKNFLNEPVPKHAERQFLEQAQISLEGILQINFKFLVSASPYHIVYETN
jgi:hypothetical protein